MLSARYLFEPSSRLSHMSRRFARRLFLGLSLALTGTSHAGCVKQPNQRRDLHMAQNDSAPRTGYAPVNGISMYYELHGTAPGVPLVLLPGGGSTIEVTYGELLPLLARQRTVLALEEQGHGRTTQRDAPIRFDTSADDVAALLEHLQITRADVMGFSNGASVALQLALRHPGKVRKLVFASSMTKRSGAPAQFWDYIASADFSSMPQPLKDAFLKVNPDPQKLRAMHDKDLERMQSFVDIPDADVRSVQAPTLILAGDRDVPTPEHAIELSRLLPHARLLLLPSGHGDYLGELLSTYPSERYPELTTGLIEQFLDAPAERP